MQKKQMLFKTKGMNLDLSVSSFNPEFSFENINLRLSTNEGNTLMSWVNEKGTEKITFFMQDPKDTTGKTIIQENREEYISFKGIPIGTAVINHKLVVFTTNNDGTDRIYVIFKTKAEDTTSGEEREYYINNLVFKGNLKFSTEYPLETLVGYESSEIEKVYWTDNKNQPRFINIIKYLDTPSLDNSDEVYTKFNFVAAADLNSSISVEKRLSGGVFAPGVIQYCYTYYNKNAQQSNIINVSPLYYLTHSTRGAKADDTVNNSFLITINNPDPGFNMVRLYSIQRTSWNTTPYVRSIEDFPIILGTDNTTNDIIYVDTGTSGTSIDPTEMLFLGGREITALTIEEKDLTLFLGNIEQKENDISTLQEFFKDRSDLVNFYNKGKEQSVDTQIIIHPEDWIAISSLGLNRMIVNIDDYINESYSVTMDGESLPLTVIGNHLIIYYSSNRPTLDKTIHYTKVETIEESPKTYYLNNPTGTLYSNTFRLNSSRRDITTFKGGDYYRFGFLLLNYTGEWTEPIYILDVKNDKYPRTSIFEEKVSLPYAKADIDIDAYLRTLSDLDKEKFLKTYKRIRPLIVYPDINARCTICLGVLNPTVFNVEDRKEKIPFALASWYFRPNSISDFVEKNSNSGVVFNKGVYNQTENATTSKGYYILLVRISAEEAMNAIGSGELHYNISYNGSNWITVPIYGAYKFRTKMLKNEEDDIKNTEFWDMFFFIHEDSIDPSVDLYIAHYNKLGYKGRPEWGINRMAASTYYNEEEDAYCYRKYTLPENVTPISGTDRTLQYVGEENTSISFNISPKAFAGSDADHEKDDLSGNYTIYFYRSALGGGSRLVNTHYESVFTDEDENNDSVKQAEIQGSTKKYITPYDSEIVEGTIDSNNLFFVDQSIVTINSPDLDFDTDVLNYSAEDLHLRIIGAIPITASASAHNITTSSTMLPLGYQTEESEWDGTIRESTTFGKGELDVNVYLVNKAITGGLRLVSDYLWEDAWLNIEGGKVESTKQLALLYLIYPWQSSRSLTNDTRTSTEACSVLKTKVESNILYSYNSSYFNVLPVDCWNINPAYPESPTSLISNNCTLFEFLYLNTKRSKVDVLIHLQENDYIYNLRLPHHSFYKDDINYYPNIDKSLVNAKLFSLYTKTQNPSDKKVSGAVLMRYKSGTHAVVSLKNYYDTIVNILPCAHYLDAASLEDIYAGMITKTGGNTFWGDTGANFHQHALDVSKMCYDTTITPAAYKNFDVLWLGELYREVDESTLFGGTGEQAIKANNWLVGGEALPIKLNDNNTIKPITLTWTEGDTYYQRYDCLKTYPFSDQDPNLLVEILSFMCETHVNLDGKYDRNRGLRDNTMMSPTNFNLMNPVYNQLDNFFSYKIGSGSEGRYPNLITFTKTKESGADIDQWTNITLASNLELDGSKGEISSIQRLNNLLFAFQDSGISLILYNESVQIASTEGVPIEIANSQKVQGKRYYSNSIGCSNKYSICNTPSGIYFIDSNDKGIYLFNGELTNLSNKFGFNTWCKTNIFSNKKWTPVGFEDFVTYYDRQNQDVLFINRNTALAFSEKLGVFTSFYSYNNTPYFCNLDDIGLWINKDNAEDKGSYKLWKHRGGEYCSFFGRDNKPYSMTLISNPEPLVDKMFTNLEFRANIDNDGESRAKGFIFYKPFDSIEAWNDYQHGKNTLDALDGKIGNYWYKHNSADGKESLKRNFRIWRCDIPRDNCEVDTNTENKLGIFRYKKKPADRMRNPWIYLKLAKDNNTNKRTEIHDVVMTYFE